MQLQVQLWLQSAMTASIVGVYIIQDVFID